MTTTATMKDSPPEGHNLFDPDSFRMSMGDHLEELRRRLIYGGIGLIVAVLGCLVFGERVMGFFIQPLIDQLQKYHLNTQLVIHELGDGFMVYMRISLICAAIISAPWMIYQIWQFVAAGLYPHERKYITRYIPLSIALLISSVVFVYYIILPWTIAFFLIFNNGVTLDHHEQHVIAQHVSQVLPAAPILEGDPPKPLPGQFWFNKVEGRLKFYLGSEEGKDDVRVIQFGSSNLLTEQLSLPEYIDLVLMTLLTFGLCFQLPLVVLALERIGIVKVEALRRSRRYVYFGLAVLAATMTPGDVVTAMIALMAPLIVLFELGIFLAAWGGGKTVIDPV
jgi:sec-independent protein translocase protein TatC